MNKPSPIGRTAFRLVRLDRADWLHLSLLSIVVGLLVVVFHLLGNTTDVSRFGHSALGWMINRWMDPMSFGGEDYSHGFLIPLVSGAIVWMKRRELAALPKSINNIGAAVFALGLALHWLGAKTQQTRLSLFGLVLIIWGTPFYLCGWPVARTLIFPCAYLIFCIPLNFFDVITFPLRLFGTAVSAALLNGLGIPVAYSGSIIESVPPGAFRFGVADACSGIRSILALTAITGVYAYFTQRTLIRQWILFLSALPLAVLGNIARIISIVLVAQAFGADVAHKIYHDYSGYIFFPVSVSLMIGLGRLLDESLLEGIKLWWQKHTKPMAS